MSLDVNALESTTTGPADNASLVTAIAAIGKKDATGDTHATVTRADLCTPYLVSAEAEDSLVRELRAAAEHRNVPAVAHAHHFWLLACVRARKGDVARALALASNYMQWRLSLRADELDAARSEKMRAQLRRRILFVAGNTDRLGRPVLNLRMRNQDPSQYAAIDTTRMISFVLEWTLRTYRAAQTHGMVILSDMSGVGFHNLDLRMPGVIQKAFSKTVPVRLAAMNMANPPFFFRMVFPLVQNVMSRKIKARVSVYTKNDVERLEAVFAKDQIPDDVEGMGGTYSWTDEEHEAWVERMFDDCQTWPPFTEYKEES